MLSARSAKLWLLVGLLTVVQQLVLACGAPTNGRSPALRTLDIDRDDAAAAGEKPDPGKADAKPDGASPPAAGTVAAGANTTSNPVNGSNQPVAEQQNPAKKPAEKKTIHFSGSKGDNVPGYLWLPERAAAQKFPAVLLMYGINGNKDDGGVAQAAEALSESGIVTMTFDWPGAGERGNISNTDRITNKSVMEWTVADYGAAMNFLATQPEIDAGKLAYVGASMGAMTGIVFSVKDARVKAMAAIVPIPNPLWGGDNPASRIRDITNRPLLCIYATEGGDMSSSVCQNAPGGNTKGFGGGHELTGYRDQVVSAVKDFLLVSLK